MEIIDSLINFLQTGINEAASTTQLFIEVALTRLSVIGILDIVIIVAILTWLFRQLRRSDLIKVLPRLLTLLLIMLVARLLGLWSVFYLTGFLLVISLLALGSLYASEIKSILELKVAKPVDPHKAHPISTADLQTMIKAISEAMAVLVRSQKSALIVIKRHKSINRLAENGSKMNSVVKAELLIDFFTSGSNLSKGAVIIEGNRIVSAGSTLWRPNAKVLFSITNPQVMQVADDLDAIVIVANKTIGDINLLVGDDKYKNLSPQDLTRLLQNILIYHKEG